MEKASVLPPQMIGLSARLGEAFRDAATPDAVAETVLAFRKGGGTHA